MAEFRRVRKRILGEWAMVGRHNITLDEYRRMSLFDRWHLQKSVRAYLEMIHGAGAELNPEE